MLVLTRKREDSIKIGDNIVVKVIQTGRGFVKLGIEAPSDVRIMRGELAEQKGSHLMSSESPAEAKDVATPGEIFEMEFALPDLSHLDDCDAGDHDLSDEMLEAIHCSLALATC